jgi:hypothetical protein
VFGMAEEFTGQQFNIRQFLLDPNGPLRGTSFHRGHLTQLLPHYATDRRRHLSGVSASDVIKAKNGITSSR